MSKQDLTLNIISIIFMIFGLGAFIYFSLSSIGKALWFCYIGLIIMSIAIYKRNSFWLNIQLNLLTISTFLWTIDFIIFIISGHFIIGVSTPFFTTETFIEKIISIEHFIIIPLGFYALYKLKINLKTNKILLATTIQIILIFILTKFISPPSLNINCVTYTCLPFNFPTPYLISWFLIAIPVVFITHYIIANIPLFKK